MDIICFSLPRRGKSLQRLLLFIVRVCVCVSFFFLSFCQLLIILCAAMSQLKILSLNVRGLRNREKRRSMFSYLKNQKAGIYFLQETFSRSLDEKIWSAEWDGQILFSHGSEHSCGVCVLMNLNSLFCAEKVDRDPNGRYIILRLRIGESSLNVVNLNAPTDYREQTDFIDLLRRKNLSPAYQI